MCTLLEYNKKQTEIMREVGVVNYFKKIKLNDKIELSPAEIVSKFRYYNNFEFHLGILTKIIKKNI